MRSKIEGLGAGLVEAIAPTVIFSSASHATHESQPPLIFLFFFFVSDGLVLMDASLFG